VFNELLAATKQSRDDKNAMFYAQFCDRPVWLLSDVCLCNYRTFGRCEMTNRHVKKPVDFIVFQILPRHVSASF
jgi:hypothetical protein